MNKYIKALIKVTPEKDYAECFRNGRLYMNELRYFCNCEQAEIGDSHEARAATIQYQNIMVHLIDSMDLCRPIFCLYGIYEDKHSNMSYVSIDPRMSAFGKYAVVVKDVSSFFERLNKRGLEFSPVMYYKKDVEISDPDFKHPYNPAYRKLPHFNYQHEFRIIDPTVLLTRNSSEKYQDISLSKKIDDVYTWGDIGDIHGITSEVIPLEEILQPNRFNIDLTANWEKIRYQDFVRYENPMLPKRRGGKK